MNFFSFLAGPSGKTSSIRLATFLVLFNTMALIWHAQITRTTMPQLDPTWAGLILGAMGIQVIHKGKESEPKPDK